MLARGLSPGTKVLMISDNKKEDLSGRIPFEIDEVVPKKSLGELWIGAVGRDGSYHGLGRYSYDAFAWKML